MHGHRDGSSHFLDKRSLCFIKVKNGWFIFKNDIFLENKTIVFETIENETKNDHFSTD